MPEALQIQLKKGVLEMCVLALLSKGDNYAYDIASRMAEAVGMEQSAVSHHLRLLRDRGLVVCYRRGRTVIYALHRKQIRLLLICVRSLHKRQKTPCNRGKVLVGPAMPRFIKQAVARSPGDR